MRFRQIAGIFVLLCAICFDPCRAGHGAEDPTLGVGTIVGDNVNVRGKATLASEVVTRVQKGDKVTILEELAPQKLKPDEPPNWFRIVLPLNTPVWVHAGFLDESGRVAAHRLNLRAGAGENFSVLGRIEKGTAVNELRRKEEWMEIEAPAGAYAFVAADLVEFLDGMLAKASRAASPGLQREVVPNSVGTVEPPPSSVEKVATDPVALTAVAEKAPEPKTEVVVVEDTPPAVASPASPIATLPTPATTSATVAVDVSAAPVAALGSPRLDGLQPIPGGVASEGKPTRRIVLREGLVSGTFFNSIQAPTFFALRTVQDGRLVNYLHAGKLGLKLESYKGRKVQVTGEEFMDRRWAATPVLEVESVELVP